MESAAKSNVAAFVTLPGVKDSLSGLLPNELDTIEDYLQDTITVEADVTGLTCPQVMMACATNAAALGTDNVFDLNSINDLTDGINQLNDAMSSCWTVLLSWRTVPVSWPAVCWHCWTVPTP
mgnify:CR=1 FL=1